MTADIKQNDFSVGNHNGKGDALAVSNTDSLNTFEVSTDLHFRHILFYHSNNPPASRSTQTAAPGAAGLYLNLSADAFFERRNVRDDADQLAVLLQA
jgi:hypothetical protein